MAKTALEWTDHFIKKWDREVRSPKDANTTFLGMLAKVFEEAMEAERLAVQHQLAQTPERPAKGSDESKGNKP